MRGINKPVLSKGPKGCLEYRVSPFYRLGMALAGLGFAWFGRGGLADLPPLAWYSLALVLVAASLSQDRFTLFPGPEGIRRRFGLFPLSRTWSLPKDDLHSLCLKEGRAGESAPGSGADTDKEKMAASLMGMGRHDWVALVLVLNDGRSLVIDSSRPRHKAVLASSGQAMASFLGIPFEAAP